MAHQYPPNIGKHVKELRKDFQNALAQNKKLPKDHPLTAGTADLIKEGVRHAISICASANDWFKPPDKQALNEFQELVVDQVTGKLHARMHESVLFDAVSRKALVSLNASFGELSRKIVEIAANARTDEYSLYPDVITIPASPAETVAKAEHFLSSLPSNCQHEQHCSPTKKNDTKASDITFVLTLANKDAIAGMNDSDLTNLINQSIDTDPDIPKYLTDDHWITHARLLDNGDIEIHVETEQDRKFLELNTYWRPKLEETLAERAKPPVCQFDTDEIARLYSVLCSQPVGVEQSEVLFHDTYEPGRNTKFVASDPVLGLTEAEDLVKPQSVPRPASTGFSTSNKRGAISPSNGDSCSGDSAKRPRLTVGEQ